jgi:hypothetical protein
MGTWTGAIRMLSLEVVNVEIVQHVFVIYRRICMQIIGIYRI